MISGSHLLLVAHNVSKKLMMYRLMIDWQYDSKNPIGETPTLTSDHITYIDQCTPGNPSFTSLTQQRGQTCLSHLEILPKSQASLEGISDPPTILAIFATMYGFAHWDQLNQPTIQATAARWELKSVKPELDSVFSELISAKQARSDIKVRY